MKADVSDAMVNVPVLNSESQTISKDDQILVTGAAGFIGSRVVENLLKRGFRKIRCFTRPTGNLQKLERVIADCGATGTVEFFWGNLLSKDDCLRAAQDVAVIFHLAAGTGTKSFSDAYMNSVVTTRNLVEAALLHKCLRRFVSLSSFTVYTNQNHSGVLDESCAIEKNSGARAEAYCFAKVKQDELIEEYGKRQGLPYVLIRPGVVYGPGKSAITGRVGIGTFGVFLHLGGFNTIPFTYVENCAEAVVLAGLRKGIDGEAFNIVDDDLPSSRSFLGQYKKKVRKFKSIYIPHLLSYLLCYVWEAYSRYSQQQLPPAFSRNEWWAYWKRTRYTNEKAKRLLGWVPEVKTADGLDRFFEGCRKLKKPC